MSLRFQHVIFPNFPFQNPLIKYIINNINGNLLKMLHKTCKWFFVKLPFTIFDSLSSLCESFDKYNGFFVANKMNGIVGRGNIWVLDSVYINEDTIPPSIVSKIVRCDVWSLVLGIKLTLDELKFFTNSGKVTTLGLDNKIFHSDNTLVSAEDILVLVPKSSLIM